MDRVSQHEGSTTLRAVSYFRTFPKSADRMKVRMKVYRRSVLHGRPEEENYDMSIGEWLALHPLEECPKESNMSWWHNIEALRTRINERAFQEVQRTLDKAGIAVGTVFPYTLDKTIFEKANLRAVDVEKLTDKECAICRDDVTADDDHRAVRIATCTHVFGFDCIKEWLLPGVRDDRGCPSCRAKIRTHYLRIRDCRLCTGCKADHLLDKLDKYTHDGPNMKFCIKADDLATTLDDILEIGKHSHEEASHLNPAFLYDVEMGQQAIMEELNLWDGQAQLWSTISDRCVKRIQIYWHYLYLRHSHQGPSAGTVRTLSRGVDKKAARGSLPFWLELNQLEILEKHIPPRLDGNPLVTDGAAQYLKRAMNCLGKAALLDNAELRCDMLAYILRCPKHPEETLASAPVLDDY